MRTSSLAALLASATAFAHPMGNFSINHYAKLTIAPKSIEVRYVIDMAEIPTFQEMREFGVGPPSDAAAIRRFVAQKELVLKSGVALESDGRPVPLDPVSRKLDFADGAGGLSTMKFTFVWRAKPDGAGGVHRLSWVDNNFPDRAGWKEIVARSEGVAIVESTASAEDRSQELTNYSSDVESSPPQQVSAAVRFRVEPPPPVVKTESVPPKPVTPKTPEARSAPARELRATQFASPGAAQRATNTPRSRFTELISNQAPLGLWMLLSAGLIAAGLGALHALEPGHGKTVVAAYLVGSRGTPGHAVLLGFVVTAAHTAGVYLLGIVTLYASRYIVPEQLYPWLGVISGLSVAGVGVFLFLRHATGESGAHSHAAGEKHSHWFFSSRKAESGNSTATSGRTLSLRELCVLGITGGMVPCPAALVVLLSAFSLHRIGFGLYLITAFSLGLAAVLVAVGLAMVWAKRTMAGRIGARRAAVRWLPMVSSAFMVLVGAGIVTSAIGPIERWPELVTKDKLAPFVTVVALGLLLGMRHSTDPDHVVAVSTIVSRQKTIRGSAAIGLLWGLGHTLTIFIVGSAIIVFGLVIPPRLGLTMEFCVAVMLILLGVANLTGLAGRRVGVPESALLPASDKWLGGVTNTLGLYQTLRPFAVGLVHGLAGSAAVALLVLSTIRSPLWSTAYLLVFGFGTMTGMMLMTAAISMPLVYAGKKSLRINRWLIAVSGAASMAFGMFLVYQIGFVDGLFRTQAHWTPQ
jgi:ABC-type nickel/cobalt efflux system permease component RcnA